MCFNWISVTSKPSNQEYKVTLKTTVKGAWEMIGDILEEHVNDIKFYGKCSEQDEINKVLDGVINFLEDFIETYEEIHCMDDCECCEVYACQEDIQSVMDWTDVRNIHRVSEIVEIKEFDGRVY